MEPVLSSTSHPPVCPLVDLLPLSLGPGTITEFYPTQIYYHAGIIIIDTSTDTGSVRITANVYSIWIGAGGV